MSFDVSRLIRLNNFRVTTRLFETRIPDSHNQIEIWQDEQGSLRLSSVNASRNTNYRLHFDDDLAVDVLPNRKLVVRAKPDVPTMTINHFLADQVIPRVIAQDGDIVLHAGAVRAGDGAVLILGASGRGKSTLATSFHYDGWPLMGDDALMISTDERPSASAIYPSLRLFADSMAALLPNDVTSEDMAHYSDKQRIAVPIDADGGPDRATIKAMFVIDQPSPSGVTTRKLSIAESCMAVVENSFALDPTDVIRARQRLAKASELAGKVPVLALSYPRDYASLPSVREKIRGQIDALSFDASVSP